MCVYVCVYFFNSWFQGSIFVIILDLIEMEKMYLPI
jgi:hypothetical protein